MNLYNLVLIFLNGGFGSFGKTKTKNVAEIAKVINQANADLAEIIEIENDKIVEFAANKDLVDTQNAEAVKENTKINDRLLRDAANAAALLIKNAENEAERRIDDTNIAYATAINKEIVAVRMSNDIIAEANLLIPFGLTDSK